MLIEHPEYKRFYEKYFPVSNEFMDIEFINNPPKDYIQDFFERLRKHEKYNELKEKFIYDKEMDIFAHIHSKLPMTEIAELTHEQAFFYSFMSKKEINQIFNIKSSEDYLLRLRAEQVETNQRLKRTFSKLKMKFGPTWSFSKHFDSKQYRSYLGNLKQERKEISKSIPHGTIHSSEANGMCFKTPFGNIIVLSYALQHFLYYMNIFHFGQGLGIKEEDTFRAFLIAIRIMLGKESLDFEIDPRGKLPKSINKKIEYFTNWQMRFIIGHEYAHHYLNHLESKSKLSALSKVDDLEENVRHFTYSQECEFEADSHSILETTYESFGKSHLFNGAYFFFISLYLYDQVEDYLFPKIRNSTTHPEPLERLFNLREKLSNEFGYSIEEIHSGVEFYKDFIKNFLKDYLPFNVETIEMYGSLYLSSYRKKELIDRLDF